MNYCSLCSSGCHYCEKPNKMNIKDLEQKYQELGQIIEDFKSENKPVDLEEFEFGEDGQDFPYLDTRTYGDYEDKSFYLDGRYNWELKLDPDCDEDELLLIPTKKR